MRRRCSRLPSMAPGFLNEFGNRFERPRLRRFERDWGQPGCYEPDPGPSAAICSSPADAMVASGVSRTEASWSGRDRREHGAWVGRRNHQAVTGSEIAVADVDVRLGDPLKHPGCGTGLIADRDDDHVLLLDLAKSGVRQALTSLGK